MNRRRNVQKPHGFGKRQAPPGCLARMVNLFDFGTVGSGKKLLTDKPYCNHASVKINQFDQIEDKVDTIGVNGTPMKKLLEEEMSKELEFTVGSTNLVAKLMGLESFPNVQQQPNAQRSNSSKLKRSLSHGECKDVYEFWEKQGELSNGVEGLSKKRMDMDIVHEKFLEAKRLVTDEKLRHSKEFQEAMEVLSSNKELFLEFLQESNNFFSHHLNSFQSTAPPTPENPKRITILKPSKTIDGDKFGNEAAAAIEPLRDGRMSEKGLDMFKWPVEEECATKKSTRIVVLKPNGLVRKASSCPTSPRGLPKDGFEERARRVRREMVKEESLHSSVFSNGYIGDDSYYADSEIMSPVSRHSWDYIKKYDSPFSSSPFSRASGSPESSSVSREAKKRLSERWALMTASNENLQEAKAIHKKAGNISLGNMLALSDSKTDLRTEEEEEANDGDEEHDPGVSASCLSGNYSREEGSLKSFKGLQRSKSLPESTTSLGHRALDNNNSKSKASQELTKSKSLKWSLKGKVSNFLFSRNKKASNERCYEENPKSLDTQCNNECDASVSARSMVSREAGNSSEWLYEHGPVPVFETSSDEDDGIFFNNSVLSRSSLSPEPGMMMSNVLGKSPSIGRNISFNCSSKHSTTPTRDEEEDLRLLINTLLSLADLDEETEPLSKWHSVESPLDPSLRESYADSTEETRLGSSVKKLVFDLVNTLLLELTPNYLGPCGSKLLSGKTLRVYVINRMQECLKGKGRVEDEWWDEDGDLGSLVVNKVVRNEVAQIGSKESLRLEMDCMGEELELKLLEELVEEVLMDLSEQDNSFIPSIC